MILAKLVPLGFANLCCTSVTSNESRTFPNQGDGGSIQLSYIVSGECFANRGAVEGQHFVAGQMYDLESTMGQPFFGWTEEQPVTWVGVCPDPFDRRLDYQLIRGGEKATLVGDGKERFLVALVGAIEANGKTISEHKFARINEGQQVSVQVPEGSVAVVLAVRT